MFDSDHRHLSAPIAALLAVAAGLLYSVSQPGWGIWPLAGVTLAPLLLAFWGRPPFARAGIGWVMGSVGAAVTIGPTLYACATRFFQLDTVAALAVVAGVGQLFGAIPVALFAVACGDPARHSVPVAVARFAAAWVGCELLRTVAWSGLPWAFLAHALVPVPFLLQAATLGGAFLVSFWLAALNASLAIAVIAPRRRPALGTALAIGVAVGAHAVLSLGEVPETAGTLRVRLVQGNVSEAWRGEAWPALDVLNRLVDLTDDGDAVDLAVWPENAVSFLLPVNELPLERAAARLVPLAAHVLLGAPRIGDDHPDRFRNSAVLMKPGEGIVGYYDKVHLVPFAEYVPRAAVLLGYEGPHYVPGDRFRVLHAGDTRIGALVCYEVIFPSIARALVENGAQVLVNISNDYWLGGPAGGEQHFAAAVLRAVELRRPMLRAANTGITGAVDAYGRVLGRLDRDREGALTLVVRPSNELTLYARSGDAFAWLALLLCVAVPARDRLVAAVRSSRAGS